MIKWRQPTAEEREIEHLVEAELAAERAADLRRTQQKERARDERGQYSQQSDGSAKDWSNATDEEVRAFADSILRGYSQEPAQSASKQTEQRDWAKATDKEVQAFFRGHGVF
jgi:hypothetical protein